MSCAQGLTLSTTVLDDKIKGGWLGKTAGVCIGGPTELQATDAMYLGSIDLYPDMAGGFNQDDMYVQVPFVAVMDSKVDETGDIFSATMQDYGDAFRTTEFQLWVGNEAARNLLRQGTLPPFSGMWAGTGHRYNGEADAIDFQIECDWAGFMCPAMPATAVELMDRAGHVIGYGDGVYGGYFLGACNALAFQYQDIHTIVQQALTVLPAQSLYYRCISDVVQFHNTNPDSDYTACWRYINPTWRPLTRNPSLSSVLNGAWVTLGLLYGDGDVLKTIEYACRCGDDSDCNPSNAAAIIGVMIGYHGLPAAWRTSIEAAATSRYSYTTYTWSDLMASSCARARAAITTAGGTVRMDSVVIAAQNPPEPKTWEAMGADPVLLDSSFVRAYIGAAPYIGKGSTTVAFDATASIGAGLAYFWDFGDGATSTQSQPQHFFSCMHSADTFFVTLRVQGARGADTAYARIYLEAVDSVTYLKRIGTPIVSVISPTGGGSRNLNIFRDDEYPDIGGYDVAYDTYDGNSHMEDYFGYTFPSEHRFVKIRHLYGHRDPDPQGGVFVAPRVQVRVNALWTDVQNAVVSPAEYDPAIVTDFDSFTITFPPVTGDGIRVIGAPRGGSWVGCAELDVFDTTIHSGMATPGEWEREGAGVSLTCMPNPFNPAVRIRITGLQGRTELRIYDFKGAVAMDLVPALHFSGGEPGERQVLWNASEFPSGIYLVKAIVDGKTLIKKVTLIK